MSGTEDIINLDLNDIAGGKVELSSFQEKITHLNTAPYAGKRVRLAGCAPTWAHLLVAGKLFPVVSGMEFAIDDGKDGKNVEFWKES